MKPEGRIKTVQFPGKTDGHFKKEKCRNWWEGITQILTRSRLKQIYKKEIDEQICKES